MATNFAVTAPLLPTTTNSDHWVTGSYNNPFASGSLEYDAYQKAHNISVGVTSAKNNISKFINGTAGYMHDTADDLANYLNSRGGESEDPGYYDPGSASGGFPATPQELEYIDAPYAELYGMDVSTAYQEALANTAYQRKVADLKAAGLNPVLGYSGAGSDSFYGTPAASYSGGVSYGSLGSGKSTSSAAETATKLQYWLPTLVNGVTNMAFTLGTKNGMTGYAAGTIAQNMVSGALGAIRNHAS